MSRANPTRHGEPADSARGCCYGSLDVQLSPEGIAQAHAIAGALASEDLDAIYTSPLQRCVCTAEVIAAGRGCLVQRISELRELDFGAFEGRSYVEIARNHPEMYRQWMENPAETLFPNGQSLRAMSERVINATSELLTRHTGECIAVVTLGGPARVILGDALGIRFANLFRIQQDYGAISRVRYMSGVPTVESMNWPAGSGKMRASAVE